MDDNITRRMTVPSFAAPSRQGLDAFGVSECGPVRSINQDAFTFDIGLGLFIVADGMGGHAAGEIASRLAIETIVGFMARSTSDDDPDAPAADPSLSPDANRLRTALTLANDRIRRAAASHEDYHGMGTTVVAVLFSGANFIVAHAGDSRVYQQYNGELTQLTKDDSLIELLDEMDAPAEVRERHAGQRNVVTNVLGGDDDVLVHVLECPRGAGRVLLLCSDGVHGVLDAGRIGGILASHDGPRPHAERLVREALAAGGRDNATALVVADGA
jgi:protein phosphatase